MLNILRQFGRLLGICVRAPGGKLEALLFCVVVVLDLGSVYTGVRLVQWTGEFYAAVQKVDAPETVRQIGIFFLIIGLNSARELTAIYLRKLLELRWRRSLTDRAIDLWTTNKAFWHLAHSVTDRIDNPDQRIADDCRIFINRILGEALDLISRIVGLFSYLVILWNLSDFPLSLSFIGLDISIPYYMVWAAFIYVALSSGLTHLLGRPIKGLLAEQQRREASFRFSMARWRTTFDEVALSNGEEAEKRTFRARFEDVATNWRRLMRQELILGTFTHPFQYTVLRIPLFVALPGYLAGHVVFSGLMQLSMAFSNVVTTLSWFIFSYRDLSELVATSSRLDSFMQAAFVAAQRRETFDRTRSDGATVIDGLSLSTPDGRQLLSLGALEVRPGETVWLNGASGIGKTTLTRAMAGFWPHGEGRIGMGAGEWMFLPQRSYLPDGSLQDAAAYPATVNEVGRDTIRRALDDVRLSHIDPESPAEGLSGGERQRLALARLLVHQPQWAVLDEATSALDPAAEEHLLHMLKERLPQTAFIIIAHRLPHSQTGARTLDLQHRKVSGEQFAIV